MSPTLAKHLGQSPAVRHALGREAVRLLWFVACYIGTMALSRYFRGKLLFEDLWPEALIIFATFLVAWSVSAIRTARAVLREHDLL